MPYNILLLPLLGGYVFITRWYRTRWYAGRADKERLIIYAALAGASHLGLSFLWLFLYPFLVIRWPSMAWLSTIHQWWIANVPFAFSGTGVIAFLIGLLGWILPNAVSDLWHGGAPWPFPEHWRRGREAAIEGVIRTSRRPLELTLLRSLKSEKRVLLTLANGKVYIGRIDATVTPDDKTLSLWPMQSGYRDSLQRLNITTRYDEAYARMSENANHKPLIKDFRVAIPIDQVISATLYSEELHEMYFSHEVTPPPPPPPPFSTLLDVSE